MCECLLLYLLSGLYADAAIITQDRPKHELQRRETGNNYKFLHTIPFAENQIFRFVFVYTKQSRHRNSQRTMLETPQENDLLMS